MREIVKNDCNSKPKIIKRDYIIMEDETMYKIFSAYDNVRGHCIDQVIIVDDDRWMIYEKQKELIDWIKYRIDCTSCVPEEFQVLEYKW